jgi:hypothetical protein
MWMQALKRLRFVKGTPTANSAPTAVWINKPKGQEEVMAG